MAGVGEWLERGRGAGGRKKEAGSRKQEEVKCSKPETGNRKK
jgi:hypothetical protein